MKITKSMKLLAGAALALALGGAAHASTNILSGNECTAYYPSEMSGNLGLGIYHVAYGTESLAADRGIRTVMCPILRDQTGSTGGLTKLAVNTSVRSGFSGAVSCLGYVLTKFGSVKVSKWKSGASTGQNTLTWTELNSSDNGSGAFDMQCNLPYASSVNSIEYQEP